MKYFIILIAFALAFSCVSSPKVDCSKKDERIKSDSIALVNKTTENHKLFSINAELRDSLVALRTGVDTIKTQLFLSNFKVEKVRYYLKIVSRDRTQETFLRGWVTRAVE